MPFGQTTLLGYIIERAKKQTPELILNVNGDQNRVLSYGLQVLKDDFPDRGPLGGILAAMKFAKTKGFDHIVTFACDSPFFPDDYVDRLVGDSEDGIVLSMSGEKRHPVMGIFAVTLADDLKSYLEKGGRRVMDWITRHDPKTVVWNNMNPDPFFNINRVQDLEQAEKYLTLKSGP